VRASPGLVRGLLDAPDTSVGLAAALRRSNDHDLAAQAGFSLGPRTRSASSALSPREQEVLELVRRGLTNAAIAKLLFISEATVKVHVRHILEKLGARTRTEAATREITD